MVPFHERGVSGSHAQELPLIFWDLNFDISSRYCPENKIVFPFRHSGYRSKISNKVSKMKTKSYTIDSNDFVLLCTQILFCQCDDTRTTSSFLTHHFCTCRVILNTSNHEINK